MPQRYRKWIKLAEWMRWIYTYQIRECSTIKRKYWQWKIDEMTLNFFMETRMCARLPRLCQFTIWRDRCGCSNSRTLFQSAIFGVDRCVCVSDENGTTRFRLAHRIQAKWTRGAIISLPCVCVCVTHISNTLFSLFPQIAFSPILYLAFCCYYY